MKIAVTKDQAIACLKSLAPVGLALAATGVANAAPSIDFSGLTSVMSQTSAAFLAMGAIVVLIGVVFSVFSFFGGNVMRGIAGLAGGLIAGAVIGFAPAWVGSLTGQSL